MQRMLIKYLRGIGSVAFVMKQMNQSQRGFTLIELAIVIALLAILAAVAVARLADSKDSAELATAKDFKLKLTTALATYTFQNSTTPTDLAQVVKVGPLLVGDTQTVSMANFGKGLCTLAPPSSINCPNTAFPNLFQNRGITISYTYDPVAGTLTTTF